MRIFQSDRRDLVASVWYVVLQMIKPNFNKYFVRSKVTSIKKKNPNQICFKQRSICLRVQQRALGVAALGAAALGCLRDTNPCS